jgi:hypothetical protein
MDFARSRVGTSRRHSFANLQTKLTPEQKARAQQLAEAALAGQPSAAN